MYNIYIIYIYIYTYYIHIYIYNLHICSSTYYIHIYIYNLHICSRTYIYPRRPMQMTHSSKNATRFFTNRLLRTQIYI